MEKKLYDLSYWIKIEADYKKVEEKIKNLIENLGGEFVALIPAKKRNLAYPIKKENVGYLGTVFFKIESQMVEKLDFELKKMEEILRFLIVRRKTVPKNLISSTSSISSQVQLEEAKTE